MSCVSEEEAFSEGCQLNPVEKNGVGDELINGVEIEMESGLQLGGGAQNEKENEMEGASIARGGKEAKATGKSLAKYRVLMERVGLIVVMAVMFVLLLLPIIFYNLPVEVEASVRKIAYSKGILSTRQRRGEGMQLLITPLVQRAKCCRLLNLERDLSCLYGVVRHLLAL